MLQRYVFTFYNTNIPQPFLPQFYKQKALNEKFKCSNVQMFSMYAQENEMANKTNIFI